jgi:hypothetical protein
MAGIWRVNWGGVQAPGQSVQAQKAAQLARAREERRRLAESDAQRLVTEARSLDTEALIPHTLRLLSRSLKVDHVTLTLGPDTRPKAICYANPTGATIISGSDFYSETEPPLLPPTDGAVSRLHAFVYSTNEPEPIGCLTLHSMEARSFRSAEVALVDALAELLALELQRPAGISAFRRRSGGA